MNMVIMDVPSDDLLLITNLRLSSPDILPNLLNEKRMKYSSVFFPV